MPAELIRVATIGAWGHLGDPLAAIATMPDAAVVAHARATDDDEPANVRRLTRDQSLPWYEDYHRMLREMRPDVVIVSTRIDRINPIAIEVAQAGCHIICEKPLAISHTDLRRLFNATLETKVQCIAMLGNLRHPVMHAAARVIDSGEAGDVVLINARKSYKWGERPEWFGRRENYGGSIGWVAVHALEMIHLLTGQDFVSVSAMQSNLSHPERPQCEDNGIICFRLSGGGHASVSFDFLRPAGANTHGDDWLRIACARGIIEASLDRGWCRFTSDKAPEREIALPPRGQYYEPFLRGIANSDGSPMPETRRSFMLTHVGLVARDAADQGTVELISNEF